jgi:DNA-binding CsgD family transcriptional regulator
VMSMLPDQPPSAPVPLRPRLIQVCDLVVLGFTNRQIGESIGITEAVIKNYLRPIYDVTGMFSCVEWAIFWNSHGISNESHRPMLRASAQGASREDCAYSPKAHSRLERYVRSAPVRAGAARN